MSTLLWIILTTVVVSLISFIGVFTLAIKRKFLENFLLSFVALSAGVLIGDAFLHLIPEAVEKSNSLNLFLFVIAGIILFFLIEKVLHWRHCHKEHCHIHAFAYINLLGDSVHNFIDGLIIAASFVASTGLGLATTLAIIMHEVPQEIGDFGVLLYGGFSKARALFYNFITALTAVAGGIIGYFIAAYTASSMTFLIPFAAGGFIYIAAADLIPEIRKETDKTKSIIHFVIFVAGILAMYLLKFVM